MKQFFKTGAVLATLLAVAACSDSDNAVTAPPEPAAPQAVVRVMHASPDAPAVNVSVDGTEIISGADYAQVTDPANLDEGTYSVQVDGILPGDALATVIGPADLTFAGDTEYTIIAVGDVANIEPLIVEKPVSAIAAGNIRVRVVHAAPMVGEVSVFVTAPDADLNGEMPFVTAPFKGVTDLEEVPAGTYQIRITDPIDLDAVAFDSGPLDLAEGSDLLVVAIENTGTGPSPVKLLAQTADSSLIINDKDITAEVQAIHASADAPPVNIVVNDDFANPPASDLAFGQFTPFVPLTPPGEYNIKVTAANDTVIAIDATLDFAADTRTTIVALNELAAIEALVLADDRRRVATEAKVRIVHASPTAMGVDIYVTAPGTDINTVEPLDILTNIPFNASTGYLSLDPGMYDVTVVPTGTKTAAIGPATIDVSGGGIYTAIAVDAVGGGAPLGLILTDDFAAM